MAGIQLGGRCPVEVEQVNLPRPETSHISSPTRMNEVHAVGGCRTKALVEALKKSSDATDGLGYVKT